MRSLSIHLAFFTFCFTRVCFGQLTLDKSYYPRVIVPEDIFATVTVNEVTIDTLIMHDNSSLRFTRGWTTMKVKDAHIDGKVNWDGRGKSGEGRGDHGTNGVNMNLTVFFRSLGQLTIDTRGGAGSAGENGRAEFNSNWNGRDGGNGGNGGNIQLRYKCTPSPTFDRGKRNAIHFKAKGGAGGTGGMGAPARSSGSIVLPGQQGNKGRDGQVIYYDMDGPDTYPVTRAEERSGSFVGGERNEYDLFVQMLSSASSVLNQPNRTTHLFKSLKELEGTLRLGMTLSNVRNESLSVALPGKDPFTLAESAASVREISSLWEYLRPAIEKKLDSVKLVYRFPEFITDYVMTSIEATSSLVTSEAMRNNYQRRLTPDFQCMKDPVHGFIVQRIPKDSEAYKAGLREGDHLATIGDIPTAYLGGGAFSNLVSLDSNEYRKVQIRRNDALLEITLPGNRSSPASREVKMERLSEDVLYLFPGELSSGKAKGMKTFIQEAGKYNALILDLRDCPGGLLSEAADIARIFLHPGDTIGKFVISSRPHSPDYYLGTSSQPIRPGTIAILTNGNTASGAEIIVSALKYHGVAKIVGSATYGLTRIMTHVSIGLGRYSLQIKAGEIYGPGGTNLSSTRIQPDIAVEDDIDLIPFVLELIKK